MFEISVQYVYTVLENNNEQSYFLCFGNLDQEEESISNK